MIREARASTNFDNISKRRLDILRLVAERKTLKQVATELGISESAVNQHVKALKLKLKVNSLTGLAASYHCLQSMSDPDRYRNSACTNSGLTKPPIPAASSGSDDFGTIVQFRDSMHTQQEAPWNRSDEPEIVPRMLNGSHGRLLRIGVSVAIAFGCMVLVLVSLGVAEGLTSAIESRNILAP